MTNTKRDAVREILQEYRYKPRMDDLNPTAWEKVYLREAKRDLLKLVKGCVKGSRNETLANIEKLFGKGE